MNKNRIQMKKNGALFLMLLIITAICIIQSSNSCAQEAAPSIRAEGAILMNADTGEVLYEKNADTRYYPASITKMMTALLVIENSELDSVVTFSKTATTNLERGAVTLEVSEGDKISVRDCLYGLMLKSANEVANGLAEHVGGSIEGFASMMNDKARELGCTNTNFANPSGLTNSAHYTTARDMALIAKACFNNSTFREINGTESYTFPAVKNSASKSISIGHKMLRKSDSRYYEGIIGGKTGYTSKAGQTLVTGAQRNGKKLIVVILKSTNTRYEDTRKLLDYGFAKAASSSSGEDSRSFDNTNKSSSEKTYEKLPYKTGWIRNKTGWYYLNAGGSWYALGRFEIDGESYWFDGSGYMVTGWQQDGDGYWYYMTESGTMQKSSWLQYNNQWYYLGADGRMYTNTTTSDGYYVNNEGIWAN